MTAEIKDNVNKIMSAYDSLKLESSFSSFKKALNELKDAGIKGASAGHALKKALLELSKPGPDINV